MNLMKIEVGVSNRHCHLTEDVFKLLFGKDSLTFKRPLKQPYQFAAEETITISGPKGSIERVRVLGPFRKYNQVEIAKSDAYKLGVNPPICTSGEFDGAVTLKLTGPAGEIELPCGILANRHVHISQEEAEKLNVKDKDPIKIIVHGAKSGVVDGYFKVSKEAYKELHIDIDDANSLLLKQDDIVEIEY